MTFEPVVFIFVSTVVVGLLCSGFTISAGILGAPSGFLLLAIDQMSDVKRARHPLAAVMSLNPAVIRVGADSFGDPPVGAQPRLRKSRGFGLHRWPSWFGGGLDRRRGTDSKEMRGLRGRVSVMAGNNGIGHRDTATTVWIAARRPPTLSGQYRSRRGGSAIGVYQLSPVGRLRTRLSPVDVLHFISVEF